MGKIEEFVGVPDHEEAARQALPAIKKMDPKTADVLEKNSNIGGHRSPTAQNPQTETVAPKIKKGHSRLRGKYRDHKMAQANDDF